MVWIRPNVLAPKMTTTNKAFVVRQRVHRYRNRTTKVTVYLGQLLDDVLEVLNDVTEERFTEEYALCLPNGLIIESSRTTQRDDLIPYCNDGAYIVRCLATPWEVES